MSIKAEISKIKNLKGCEIYPVSGQPDLTLNLPTDLIDFYNLCGGLELFSLFKLIDMGLIDEVEHYPCIFLKPDEIAESTRLMLTENRFNKYIGEDQYSLSKFKNWYTIVDLYDGNYIVIDLNEDKLGKCYLAYHDTFLVAGEMPIIAESFTELLEKFIKNNGEYFFFLDDEFESYGDAFDGIEELEW